MASVLLRGNALAEIITDNRGAARAQPYSLGNVCVQLLPNRRFAYDVSDVTYLRAAVPAGRRLLEDEVFHLKDRSDDGLIGVSRLRRAAAVVQTGLSIQNFAIRVVSNGINPSGALEVDGVLGANGNTDCEKVLKKRFAVPATQREP